MTRKFNIAEEIPKPMPIFKILNTKKAYVNPKKTPISLMQIHPFYTKNCFFWVGTPPPVLTHLKYVSITVSVPLVTGKMGLVQ